MRVAIPKGGQYDGVILANRELSNIPENAIAPVLNWVDLLKVPESYRIVDGNSVREMTDGEKKIVDNNNLPQLISNKIETILDRLHNELLPKGFSFEGHRFSLLKEDLAFWNGIANSVEVLHIANWPIGVSDLTGTPYMLTSLDHYKQWYGAGQYQLNTWYEQTRALVNQCKAATNIDELNAVVDNRE